MFPKFTYLFFLLAAVALCSCKGLKQRSGAAVRQPPPSYPGAANDSVNSAKVGWRTYFSDSLLTRLIDEGLANNPDMHIAFQKIEAAGAGVLYTRGKLFPQVDLNAAYQRRKFGLYTMDGAGNISTDITPGQIVPIHLPDYYIGLQTSWEVDVWGKLRNKRKAAFARYLSSMEGRNLVITNLVAQIAHGYYALLFLDNELEVIRETITIQSQAMELVSFQKQAGTVTELAVKQFRSQLLNAQSMEHEILQEIEVQENNLNRLLGRYSGPITRTKTLISDSLSLIPKTGAPADLLSHRPDIRQAELELQASHADLRAAKAAFYPSLNLYGAAGFQAFQTALLFQFPQSLAYTLLGSLTGPLVNRSSIKAQFRHASAAQVEALYNYQKRLLNAYMEVNNQMAAMRNLEKIVALKITQVQETSQAWEISSELFKTDHATYIEVLMAQRAALETKLLLLDVKRRQYDASIDLYKALGGGWQ